MKKTNEDIINSIKTKKFKKGFIDNYLDVAKIYFDYNIGQSKSTEKKKMGCMLIILAAPFIFALTIGSYFGIKYLLEGEINILNISAPLITSLIFSFVGYKIFKRGKLNIIKNNYLELNKAIEEEGDLSVPLSGSYHECIHFNDIHKKALVVTSEPSDEYRVYQYFKTGHVSEDIYSDLNELRREEDAQLKKIGKEPEYCHYLKTSVVIDNEKVDRDLNAIITKKSLEDYEIPSGYKLFENAFRIKDLNKNLKVYIKSGEEKNLAIILSPSFEKRMENKKYYNDIENLRVDIMNGNIMVREEKAVGKGNGLVINASRGEGVIQRATLFTSTYLYSLIKLSKENSAINPSSIGLAKDIHKTIDNNFK